MYNIGKRVIAFILSLAAGGTACRGLDMPEWPEDKGLCPMASYSVSNDGPVGSTPLRGRMNTDGNERKKPGYVYWNVYGHNDDPETFLGTLNPQTGDYEGTATNLVLEGKYKSKMVAGKQPDCEHEIVGMIWAHSEFSDRMRGSMEGLFDGQKPGPISSTNYFMWKNTIMEKIDPEELSPEAQDAYAQLQNYQNDRIQRALEMEQRGEIPLVFDKISIVGNNIVYHLNNAGFYNFADKAFSLNAVVDKIEIGQELADKIRELYNEI